MAYGVPNVVVFLALIVVQIGFGGYGVIVKKFAANNKANPLIFCLIRDAVCWPVLLLCAVVAERKLQIPRLKEVPLFFVLGLFGMFGNQLLYIMGVYCAGADISSIFQPAIPVWTSLLAIITRIEKPPTLRKCYGWAKVIGIVLAVGGAITMLRSKLTSTDTGSPSSKSNSPSSNSNSPYSKSNSSHQTSFRTILGILFLFANTVCMAIFILVQKRFIFDRPTLRWSRFPVSVTAWCYFFGAVCMAVASFYYVVKCPHVGACESDPWHIPAQEAIPLVYAIFIASALCYMLITWGNMHLSPSLVTAFWPFQVPVAVVMSYFTLGERLVYLDYVGGALIIIGLMLVVYSNWYSEKSLKESKDALVFGRTEEERQSLLSPRSQHNINGDNDVFDSPKKAKSFASGHVQQH